jgi:hypothetical protein
MAQVNLPRQLVVDINGSPRVGARMFLYDAGTNTLRVAYTSKSYTIQHTQPILATEGGLFPVVEVNPAGGNYKIVIQDVDGVQIYTEDNLVPVVDELTQAAVGGALYPRTQAEISAGVIPTSNAYTSEPILDGRRYGFVGDGVTLNDTAMARVIAVITALGGGTLMLPKGTYLFSAGFSLPESMVIVGVGRLTTVLKANGNFTLCTLGSASARVQLRTLTLQGTSKTGTGVQIGDTNHSGQHHLSDVRITGFNVAVRFSAALWTSFYDCLIDGNKIGADYNAGSGSMYSNQITFVNCVIRGNDRSGIAATSTPVRNVGLQFIGGSIENNGSEDTALYPQVVLGALASFYFNCYGIEYSGTPKAIGFDLTSSGNGEIANINFLGSSTAITAGSGTAANIFIHNCDFNSTATRCINLPSCAQITALNNEYDLTNNVIDSATSTDITSKIAQSTTGSYTGALTGCTTTPTGSVEWTRTGDIVTLQVPFLSATSNSTAATVTGMPAAIRPSAQRGCMATTTDNGVTSWGRIFVETDGTLTLHFQGTATFTNSGSKAVNICTITYRL